MGSTRRWRRGQMIRARFRDQRRVAGIGSDPLLARMCMKIPLARAYHALTVHGHGRSGSRLHDLFAKMDLDCVAVAFLIA
jgi:hypothetical protein